MVGGSFVSLFGEREETKPKLFRGALLAVTTHYRRGFEVDHDGDILQTQTCVLDPYRPSVRRLPAAPQTSAANSFPAPTLAVCPTPE